MQASEFETYVRTNFGKTPENHGVTPSPDNYKSLWLLYIASVGLGGETGEVLEHFKKWVRDGKAPGEACMLEMGDMLHYFTVLAWAAGFSLEQIMAANKAKLDARFGR